MDNSKQPQQDKAPVKPKRNRKFHKEILEDNDKAMTLRVKHQAYKGEKISDTIRKDKKFDPKQRLTDLNGRVI
jgi:hypothetical protein